MYFVLYQNIFQILEISCFLSWRSSRLLFILFNVSWIACCCSCLGFWLNSGSVAYILDNTFSTVLLQEKITSFINDKEKSFNLSYHFVWMVLLLCVNQSELFFHRDINNDFCDWNLASLPCKKSSFKLIFLLFYFHLFCSHWLIIMHLVHDFWSSYA